MRRVIDRQSDQIGLLQAFVHSGPSEHGLPLPQSSSRQSPLRERQSLLLERVSRTGVDSQTWRSGTGRLFHFTATPLFTCRAPARAAYVLARRDSAGHAVALFVGVALSLAPTLNPARIRERAAILGATEVHVLDLSHAPGTYAARRLVRDLRAGLRHAAG
jgi:hypothetical protein